MKIAILGSGYVGLVSGVCFADAGFDVTCVDSDAAKIAKLKAFEPPFFEPCLGDLLIKNKSKINFNTEFTEQVYKSDLIFIAVGTPEGKNGEAQTDAVYETFRKLCLEAKTDFTVVIKSTVPVGTAVALSNLAKEVTKHQLTVVSNPEFLRQGTAISDFLNPDRIVIGTEDITAIEKLKKLYSPFLQDPEKQLVIMDNNSAELSKYAANSFLALKISFINELALLSSQVGANIDSVKKGFASDHRINPEFFKAGIGYGGSCFPKDIKALQKLSYENGLELLLLQACESVNDRQKNYFIRMIKTKLTPLNNKTVAIWGLSFKSNTDDVRRSVALDIIDELTAQSVNIKAYDPIAGSNAKLLLQDKFTLCTDKWEAVHNADALLILNDWAEFKTFNLNTLKSQLKTALVFDGRNLLDPQQMAQNGFTYFDFGRSGNLL